VIIHAELLFRIALSVMFQLAAGLLPEKVIQLANIATLVWISLGLISFAMLLRVYRKQLKK